MSLSEKRSHCNRVRRVVEVWKDDSTRNELLAISSVLEMTAEHLAIENACGFLPEGYAISISLERGSATVELVDPTGDTTDLHEFGPAGNVAEQIDFAVEFANSEMEGVQ